MRELLDRALDKNPDYPPGFRPVDLEPHTVAEQKNWNHGCTPMHTDYQKWANAKLIRLHGQIICMGM